MNDEMVSNIFFIRSFPKISCNHMSFSLRISLMVSKLTLDKFSFSAVLLNSVGKLCRLSYCMYIPQNSSKTILKRNMKQMEETFMLLQKQPPRV